VFGGYDGHKSLNHLWVLHVTPGKMKWERPLTSGMRPRALDSHTAVRANCITWSSADTESLRPCCNQVLLGTRMLVIGGWDHRAPSNDLYFLDTSTPAASSLLPIACQCSDVWC
jgi:hypothetical protein